jgi:DMSO/TMAO reductase YedYZ heme-binding membrane subunit
MIRKTVKPAGTKRRAAMMTTTERRPAPEPSVAAPGKSTSGNLGGVALGALIGVALASAGFAIGVGLTGLAGETTSFWYLSRSAGMVAYLLLWGSMVWGLLLSSKIDQGRLRPPALLDAHQFLSHVALGFAFFHGLVLMGDRYLSFPLQAVLLPFASRYETLWVAAGQLALWLSLLLSVSFLVRKRIGQRFWRTLHFSSFLVYGLALAHAMFAGSDSDQPGMQVLYLATAGAVVFLTFYRLLTGRKGTAAAPARPATGSTQAAAPRKG